MSRKIAREVAFKVIFSNQFQEGNEDLLHHLVDTLANDVELSSKLEESHEAKPVTPEELSEEDKIYIEEVCTGVAQNVATLDDKIQANLKGWKMERIGKTDLAILRLAIYEMLYREDIPYKVSINEAVELAKVFCEESSPSFINGVLGAIVSSLSEEDKKQ